jgi:hypothetical protein
MTTVTLDDALQARIRAVAAPEEDLQTFIAAAAQEMIARRERRAAQAQAILNGPRRPQADADADFRRRHNLPDYAPVPPDDLADDAERIIAGMDPKVREEMERQGLL